MKDEIAHAALKNKVTKATGGTAGNAGAAVNINMIAQRNAIKAQLEKAIFDKMVAKTRRITGQQHLHPAQITAKNGVSDSVK